MYGRDYKYNIEGDEEFLLLNIMSTGAFMGWQIAMYLSTVKADRKRAEAFMARNWQ